MFKFKGNVLRYVLFFTIIIESVIFGYYVGKTSYLHEYMERRELCKSKIFQQKLNLNEFYSMNMKTLTLVSIFTHAQAAVALKYQICINAD